MTQTRSATINGHEIDEHASGRRFVVYIDCHRWDGSYESAKAWASINPQPWVHPSLRPACVNPSSQTIQGSEYAP